MEAGDLGESEAMLGAKVGDFDCHASSPEEGRPKDAEPVAEDNVPAH